MRSHHFWKAPWGSSFPHSLALFYVIQQVMTWKTDVFCVCIFPHRAMNSLRTEPLTNNTLPLCRLINLVWGPDAFYSWFAIEF